MTRHDLDQRLEEIADILSHDLKNQLTVVRGSVELAQETGDEEYFENAFAAIDRTNELIEEVVYLARTGELIDEMELVDLGDRAEYAWANVRTEDATLEVFSSGRLMASDRGLCHLLENFFENAIIHAGSDVTVRVGKFEEGFFVEDDGPGVPEEHRSRLFERGYKIGSESTGLGLHIVDRIADAHGWEVAVAASTDGGARIEISGVRAEWGNVMRSPIEEDHTD